MKKLILFYKLLLIVCIKTVSFCSVDASRPEDLLIKKKELVSSLKKIKELAKKQMIIKRLAQDPFKDFDYTRKDFYAIPSVK